MLKFTIMVNAQELLDENYPKEGVCKLQNNSLGSPNENYNKKREEITNLEIDQKIHGIMKITGFSKLQELDISDSDELTELNISECQKLVKLFCDNNKKLAKLTLPENNQIKILSCYSSGFTNLDWINLELPNPHYISYI